jgi:hypothetical protein
MNASHHLSGKHSMIRVSHDLGTALLEAIQQHAETYRGGKIDLDRTLSAIGDLASGFLVDIRNPGERETYVLALIHGITSTTRLKLEKMPLPSKDLPQH